ncbi:hypothetical protein N7475_006914 [Penicillium sp. IBT 31633x]|nr:hypothetical protein N7475_006914 [Penicillium sp. IBT 31633x]
MATTIEEAMHQSRKPMRSRNIALLSVFGVLSGTWLVFRILAPRGTVLPSKDELKEFQGRDSQQTDQGSATGFTARTPRKDF